MNRSAAVTIRALDLAGALAGLAVSLPLWPIIAVLIRLDSHGPCFYRATRLARGESTFQMIKFRSMTSGDGLRVTVGGDRRVTRVGRVLRATKLDELPQLLNVVRGDMSLVGPRPEDPHYLPCYPPELREIFAYRPGMTSPASLEYRHEEEILRQAGADPERVYVEEVLPAKVKIDLDYCRSRTVRSDLEILVKTARAMGAWRSRG
jgi:lipopolysaccharide/colanic/teichoic acid biosynthesis glycosyltransferase